MAKFINAHDFYKIITTKDVESAVAYLEKNRKGLINSTKYDVLLHDGSVLPPKELMRATALLMNYELDESTHAGGAVNIPLKRLGFKIVDKKGNLV